MVILFQGTVSFLALPWMTSVTQMVTDLQRNALLQALYRQWQLFFSPWTVSLKLLDTGSNVPPGKSQSLAELQNCPAYLCYQACFSCRACWPFVLVGWTLGSTISCPPGHWSPSCYWLSGICRPSWLVLRRLWSCYSLCVPVRGVKMDGTHFKPNLMRLRTRLESLR